MLLTVGYDEEKGWTASSFTEREPASLVLGLGTPDLTVVHKAVTIDPDMTAGEFRAFWLDWPSQMDTVRSRSRIGSPYAIRYQWDGEPHAADPDGKLFRNFARLGFIELSVEGAWQRAVTFEGSHFGVSFAIPHDCQYAPYRPRERKTAWDHLLVD